MALGFKRGPKRVLSKYPVVVGSSVQSQYANKLSSYSSSYLGKYWSGDANDWDDYTQESGDKSVSAVISPACIGMKCTVTAYATWGGRFKHDSSIWLKIGGNIYYGPNNGNYFAGGGDTISKTVSFIVTENNREIIAHANFKGVSKMWMPSCESNISSIVLEDVV